MTRVILYSGKGGVGKTTVAAATGVACAKLGYRTIVLSVDLAHSLFDSFDIARELFDQNKGHPLRVAENLDVQEIDVHEELDRHWGEVYSYVAMLLTTTGLSNVLAEEVAIIPGTEDVMALMYINQYVKANTYDVIVLDMPPTGDSLRFVNMTATLEWYILKRFGIDRVLVKMARPIAKRLSEYALPEDSYFEAIKNIFDMVQGADKLLVDPAITSVRLVTNAERMVIRETQRAYMYFSLYGMTTDLIVMNRLLPPSDDSYYKKWVETQAAYAEEVNDFFKPVPMKRLPLFPEEIVGQERLARVAEALFGDEDPAMFHRTAPPYRFAKNGDGYRLEMELPFADKSEIHMHRVEDNLVVRIGGFKRHVPLPRSVIRQQAIAAEMEGHTLTVRFAEEA